MTGFPIDFGGVAYLIRIRRLLFGLALLLSSLPSSLRAEECYSEYWQELFWKMWQSGPVSLGTYAKIDTGNHFQRVRSLQINEQLRWKVDRNWTLELHYAYIHGRSVVPDSPWRWQHRIELEANRTFHLPCAYLIQTRNRLEIRWVQTESNPVYRLRQRTMLVIPFQEAGALKSYSLFNELFYNASTHRFTQDRICPCQLTFSLTKTLDMNLFFLIRFFDTNTGWQKSAVLGTEFIF